MANLPRLRASDLRHKIEILQKVKADDGHGGDTISGWSVFVAVRAEVLGQDGREAVIAQALQGISNYRVRIRYRRGITDDMQIRLADGRDLNVKSVTDPNGTREQIMILASTESAYDTSGMDAAPAQDGG